MHGKWAGPLGGEQWQRQQLSDAQKGKEGSLAVMG